MNNKNFTQLDDSIKARNLTDVLNKRCKGFIKPDVLSSVVNRLDFRKQIKIDIVSEDMMKQQAKTSTEIHITNGSITSVHVKWVRCLLGNVSFGSSRIVYEDGDEQVIESLPAEIISYPLIVQLEEQNLGDLDSTSSKLLIYL